MRFRQYQNIVSNLLIKGDEVETRRGEPVEIYYWSISLPKKFAHSLTMAD